MWSSNNTAIVKVDDNGFVTTLSAGTAKIIVAAFDGNFSDTCTVTVIYAKSDSITLSRDTLTLTLDSSATLTATVIPTNTKQQPVAWSSSDTNIVKVDSNGLVTTVSIGKAKIIAITPDSISSDTCTVTVIYANSDSITLNREPPQLPAFSASLRRQKQPPHLSPASPSPCLSSPVSPLPPPQYPDNSQ